MGKKAPTLTVAGALDWSAVKAHRVEYEPDAVIFSQGDPANTVLYIEYGVVRLSVLSHNGKQAVVAVLESGDFFGEGCLAGQAQRAATATTMAASALIVTPQDELIRQIHTASAFADRFLVHMLKRNIRIEQDLVDQLFNNSEKRLARTLLLLARYGEEGSANRKIPRVSQELLAEMVGTTRARVNLFMNRFRKLGFIDYKGDRDLTINHSLLSVVLRD